MKITDLHTLLVHELKDLYSAENQLKKALPKMRDAASNEELTQAFSDHLDRTEEHIERLEEVFERLEYKAGGHHCKGMAGLIEEAEGMIAEDAPANVKDAGLIAMAQRCEHYEIAAYGCARTFARQLGMTDVAEMLQKTLDEEGNADELLTRIAEYKINLSAQQ
ncbi:MAG: ferritin-like domain-containing protein [Ardenticatenales bacterium]|nr:ferritin-like domain-containing protein [Ardenticatenales bacterium]